ncbi:MAG: HD domain-containing protein [Firmicutes bacterium]|nr:HD domain-containing protein [Bacillota bacterium]
MPASYISAVLALLLVAIILAILQIARMRALTAKIRSDKQMWQELASIVDIRLSFEEALVRIMDIVAGIVEADGYYFYIREEKENTLVLKAVKSVPTDVEVGPSYSGLVASNREAYNPPLGLSLDSLPDRVAIVGEQTAPLLSIPLRGERLVGVIHVGPLASRKVAPKQVQALSELAFLCANMVALLAERDGLRLRMEEFSAQSQISATMMRSTFEGEAAIGLFLNLGSGLVGADGGFVIVKGEPGKTPWVPACWGLLEDVYRSLSRDPAVASELLMKRDRPEILTAEEGGRSRISSWLAARDINCLWVIPFVAEGRPGTLGYLFKSFKKMENYTRPALEVIARRIASTIRDIKIYEEMLQSYLETLRSIVDLLDSQEPSTVNHSTLIAKYAREISLMMGLSSEEVETISLAAYLHDVGMMGLGEDILFKKGKLSSSEYEKIKGHAQLGATLVEPLSKPLPIAPLIRHHHERYDGWGYPAGLKGEEIPLGARIIAVADTFNAKVSSRGYRGALPYERAIADIKAAAGSQLDPKVVDAFIKLWDIKQQKPERRGKALEDCWVMRQCPPQIAATCPAFKSGGNCWEIPGVKCHMHGDTCESCLVYTEYQFRQRRPKLSEILR